MESLQDRLLNIFIETGALLDGHFQLSSGLHSSRYLQCALVLQFPGHAELIGRELAQRFADIKIDVVVAPAIGGIVVSHETARAVGTRSLFTERENGIMTLRRGFRLAPEEKVLVVEDVITTGGSTKDTIDAVINAGGMVVGAGSIVDRSNGAADVGVRRESLIVLDVPTYGPSDCPMCAAGSTPVKPGSRVLKV